MVAAASPSVLTRLDVRGFVGDLRAALPALELRDEGPTEAVRAILATVRAGGDTAVRDLTERFDGVRVGDLRVPPEQVQAALEEIPAELRRALEVAWDNIVAFYRSTLRPDGDHRRRGIRVRELRRAVARAGLYIPGGRAPLASTVLMTAGPARVAGVGELVMCSPPGSDGQPAPAVLAAAAIAGVGEVYRVGGAQAVGLMAYGTASARPVDVIVGPGNRYVAIAERLVSTEGAVGVPSAFTGPSEVAVVADATTDVDHAAIDLIVQAEHGPDGLSYLVSWSEEVLDAVDAAVARLMADAPRRADIAATLARGGYSVLVEGPDQAVAVANAIAAEHLELLCDRPETLLEGIRSAGAVFVGPWAPASVGDYVAGPSHVLPTARSARFGSALRVDDFCTHIHVVDLERAALDRLAPSVEAIAASEGLAAHAQSVRLRVEPGRRP